MVADKRNVEKPVPDHVKEYLNAAQLAELHHIESFVYFFWDADKTRQMLLVLQRAMIRTGLPVSAKAWFNVS